MRKRFCQHSGVIRRLVGRGYTPRVPREDHGEVIIPNQGVRPETIFNYCGEPCLGYRLVVGEVRE
jgi:hypothetical protein